MSNTFLDGNFAPVEHETTLVDLETTGSVPDFLDGRYVRNGPNPLGELDPATYHWFMGDGMVHGVRLRDGRAEWYRSRWIRTPSVAARLGETAPAARPRAGSSVLGANTNVVGHAGRTLALVEGGIASYELDDTLGTVGPCDFDGTVTGGYTAHPKRDPLTGELHAVSYSFARGRSVEYTVVDASGRARRTVDISVHGSPMMHDFSLTERFVVFYDLPVTFRARETVPANVPGLFTKPAQLLASALLGRVRVPDPIAARMLDTSRPNTRLPYQWDPAYPARVGVMPREGDDRDVRWFEIEPCYVFHPMNAYDDGTTITLDVVRHDRMFATELLGPDEGPPTLDRWTLDLASGKVRQERLDDRAQEFPRVDERLLGHRHRYGYTVHASGADNLRTDTVLKHDTAPHHNDVSGATQTRSFGPRTEVGEFVFVPRSPDAAEDDGVLMGLVHDRATATADLRMLDAGTLDDVASVRIPVRVPTGFHGNWLPA